MNILDIFRTLQETFEKVHMAFYYRDNLYLVQDIGDDSEHETIEDINTAFVSGTSANGEIILINADQLLQCQFHIMTVMYNGDELETNFINISMK